MTIPSTKPAAWSFFIRILLNNGRGIFESPEQYTIEGWGSCQPDNIGVSVEAMGRTTTNDGVSQSNTIYKLTFLNDVETLITVPPTESSLTAEDKLDLEMIAMEKLIESDETSVVEEPFSDWDILCDNIFGATDLACGKEFSETAIALKRAGAQNMGLIWKLQ